MPRLNETTPMEPSSPLVEEAQSLNPPAPDAPTPTANPPQEQIFEVKLLVDYWPSAAELAMNPGAEAEALAPPPNPEQFDPGVPISIEPRFKAGSVVKLSLRSAFKLVEEGKAKRADWG